MTPTRPWNFNKSRWAPGNQTIRLKVGLQYPGIDHNKLNSLDQRVVWPGRLPICNLGLLVQFGFSHLIPSMHRQENISSTSGNSTSYFQVAGILFLGHVWDRGAILLKPQPTFSATSRVLVSPRCSIHRLRRGTRRGSFQIVGRKSRLGVPLYVGKNNV